MPKIRNAPAQAPAYDDDDEDFGRTRASDVRTPLRQTRDAEVRTDRSEDEAADAFGDQIWRRPTALDAPPPRTGMVQRWVRMTHRDGQDTVNWSGKFREGWKPRPVDSLPAQFAHLTGAQQASSLITVGGMVLCEMPEKVLAQKRGYIRELNRRQELSVSAETEKISREGVAAGAAPITRQDEVRVERGSGRRPSTALAE